MDKRFASILAVLVLAFVIVFAVTKNSNDKKSISTNSNSQATNHVEGLNQKNVTLVEYGDYECPVCEIYYPTLKQVAAQYNTEIHFQFRNLPLSSIHRNAFAAARAAEAAGLQGKYWEMHDLLYDNQNSWAASNVPQDLFNDYAKRLSLNVATFKQDYVSSKVNNAINADLAAFNKTGQAMATPAFFLNGQYIDNSKVADNSGPSTIKFSNLIKAEIAKKSSASKQ